MRSEDIANRIWNDNERAAVGRAASKQAAGYDSGINFDDIPRLTEKQLANMVRMRDVRAKVVVSVRVDPQVLNWLKSKGAGLLTHISDILMNLMEAEQRAQAHK